MGSEDLFYKNRERTAGDLKRKKATRKNPAKQPQLRILIVCEDSKSSAFYFEEMAKDLGLTAVKVSGKECGSAPSSVLKFAQEHYANSVKDRNPYDKVYCVFDRDKHDYFDEAVQVIADIKPKTTFFAITTTPCFEFWLLLHFVYDTRPYQASGNKSSCDNANTKLKSYWAEYGKCKRGIYAHSKQHMQTAIANAKLLVNHNLTTNSINPQTNMHVLVENLQSIPR